MVRIFKKCGKVILSCLVLLKAYFILKVYGIDQLSNYIMMLPRKLGRIVLIKFGAKIGNMTNLSSTIIIDNAVTNDYTNLVIGEKCYIGKNVFFDLVEQIIIEDEGVISARVTFLTHADPGERLLKQYIQRKTGEIVIKKGAWVGAGVTILPGITIGECCVIGAHSLVTKDIPSYSVAVGVPAKVIRGIDD